MASRGGSHDSARGGARSGARGGARGGTFRDRNISESRMSESRIDSVDQSVDSVYRGRGSNVLEQIPTHPSLRKMINLNSGGQYVYILKLHIHANYDTNVNGGVVYFF